MYEHEEYECRQPKSATFFERCNSGTFALTVSPGAWVFICAGAKHGSSFFDMCGAIRYKFCVFGSVFFEHLHGWVALSSLTALLPTSTISETLVTLV